MEKIDQQKKSIDRVLKAIDTVKNGGMVIMTDDEDRENEGDLVFAASDVSADKINFMAKEARGLICLTLEESIVERLNLPMMEAPGTGTTTMPTAFTVSIEAREGVTTGISAADRAKTIEVAVADQTTARDLVVPGHIFPLKAKKGGVLQRAGHTEGSVDLARLAGKKSAGVICEIMTDTGEMARLSDLEKFSQKFELPIVSIEDLITFRLMNDSLIEEIKQAPVETDFGTFNGIWFKSVVDQKTHFALTKGTDFSGSVVDVRVHKQRPISDVFTKSESKGRSRINFGLKMLAESEKAVFVYLNPSESEQSMLEPESSSEGTQFDSRLYGIGAQILRNLGVQKMKVYLSSERSIKGLGGFGLEITDTKILEPTS